MVSDQLQALYDERTKRKDLENQEKQKSKSKED